MAKLGCPPRFDSNVRLFHDHMPARVQNNGEFSKPFKVTNGVKHGCVMAPTLHIPPDGSTLLTDKEAILENGQSTSIVCSVDHQASMRMQSTDFYR